MCLEEGLEHNHVTVNTTIGPLQVAIHVAQNPPRAGEQKSHWDKTNKRRVEMVIFFFCRVPVRLLLSSTGRVLCHVNGNLQRAYSEIKRLLDNRNFIQELIKIV